MTKTMLQRRHRHIGNQESLRAGKFEADSRQGSEAADPLLNNRKIQHVPFKNDYSYVREQESSCYYTSTKYVSSQAWLGVFRAGACQTSERCLGTGNCELLCSCHQTALPEGKRKGERVVEGLRTDGESKDYKEGV